MARRKSKRKAKRPPRSKWHIVGDQGLAEKSSKELWEKHDVSAFGTAVFRIKRFPTRFPNMDGGDEEFAKNFHLELFERDENLQRWSGGEGRSSTETGKDVRIARIHCSVRGKGKKAWHRLPPEPLEGPSGSPSCLAGDPPAA